MSEAEEGNNGTADSEKPGDSQTGPFDFNKDGKVDLKDIRRMLLGDKDGSIFPNWKEALVIIIAVSIFGAIAFSFLS